MQIHGQKHVREKAASGVPNTTLYVESRRRTRVILTKRDSAGSSGLVWSVDLVSTENESKPVCIEATCTKAYHCTFNTTALPMPGRTSNAAA
eukprot:scaffold14451_cov29-Tisochrysis_lutea.AAC.1